MIKTKEVRIKKLHKDAIIPQYQTVGSAGMDLHSIGYYEIKPNIECCEEKIDLVRTGLAIECPEGYEIQLRPRSGLSRKLRITLMNTPGTLDSDYRGEICLLITNHGNNTFYINPGDRIAQMILTEYTKMILLVSDELSDTNRGNGGCGSTGK